MGRVMQIAAFSLAEVTYAVGGDINYQVQESARSARFRIRAKQENVSGVLLPTFESYQTEGNNDFAMTGLGKGGQQVQRSRDTYQRAVEALVELASLQVSLPWGLKYRICIVIQLLTFIRPHSSSWTRSSRWSTGEVSYSGLILMFVLFVLTAANFSHSQRYVSVPHYYVYLFRTVANPYSEHVIIPRTENTIKCKDAFIHNQNSCTAY